MELSRALHLPSSIQSRELLSQWVMSLHTTRNSGGKMNLYFAAIYFVSGDHWGARDHVGSQAEVTAPSSLLRAGISFWLEILVSGRDDEMTSQSLNTFPASRASSDETCHLSLSRRPCHGVYCTVHGQSVLGPRESERVVECYWLLWSLKITEFHWCCNLTIISFDEAFENVWGC